MRGKRKSVEHKKFIKELYAKRDPKAIIGIYRISTVHGHSYIGSSTDIAKRWVVHVYELKNKVHGNYKMQKVWDDFGKECFSFEVIWKSVQKPMDRNKLYQIEQEHINLLKPNLNIELTVSMKKERPKKGTVKRLPASDAPEPSPYILKKDRIPKKPSKLSDARRIENALRKLNAPVKPGGVKYHKYKARRVKRLKAEGIKVVKKRRP